MQDSEVLTDIEYWILKRICSENPDWCSGSVYEGKSKLDVLFGSEFRHSISGKTIIDFGCGEGDESIEMAQRGAKRVIGIDIRDDVLQAASQKAFAAGVQHICQFAACTSEPADMVVSIDAFEHFAEPSEMLRIMNSLLQPQGTVFISFGPTWYHPLGGHLFSVFPWAHLIFSEKALIRWRSTFKADGATRFSEVAGGLNQMTIRKFEKLIEGSELKLSSLECVPIRKLRRFQNRLTREFTTAIVRCRLLKRS
jgi:SAM-dependent methyltransferase